MKTRAECTKIRKNSKNSTSERECKAKLSQKEEHGENGHPVWYSIHSPVAYCIKLC